MSITFELAQVDDPTHFELECSCGVRSESTYASYKAAIEALTALQDARQAVHPLDETDPDADMCLLYSASVTYRFAVEAPYVNATSVNARFLLEALGLSPLDVTEDLSGSTSGSDLLGRVLLALAIAPADAGVPAHSVPDNARWIECGRDEGYLQRRLGDLHALALVAAEHDMNVQWC